MVVVVSRWCVIGVRTGLVAGGTLCESSGETGPSGGSVGPLRWFAFLFVCFNLFGVKFLVFLFQKGSGLFTSSFHKKQLLSTPIGVLADLD